MASYRLGMFLTNTGHIASICLLRRGILSFTTGCDARRVPEKNLAAQIYFIRPHKFVFSFVKWYFVARVSGPSLTDAVKLVLKNWLALNWRLLHRKGISLIIITRFRKKHPTDPFPPPPTCPRIRNNGYRTRNRPSWCQQRNLEFRVDSRFKQPVGSFPKSTPANITILLSRCKIYFSCVSCSTSL